MKSIHEIVPLKECETMEIRVRLEFSRTTKNTYVYVAEGDAAVRTLYVQKDAVPDGNPPAAVIATVTSDD